MRGSYQLDLIDTAAAQPNTGGGVNPESGTINYVYDEKSNLLQGGCPRYRLRYQRLIRSVTTNAFKLTNMYDALNRPTYKAFHALRH